MFYWRWQLQFLQFDVFQTTASLLLLLFFVFHFVLFVTLLILIRSLDTISWYWYTLDIDHLVKTCHKHCATSVQVLLIPMFPRRRKLDDSTCFKPKPRITVILVFYVSVCSVHYALIVAYIYFFIFPSIRTKTEHRNWYSYLSVEHLEEFVISLIPNCI